MDDAAARGTMSTDTMSTAVGGAVCAAHPEERSTGACPRCGTFVCETCGPEASSRLCAVCRPLVLDPLGVVSAKFDIAEVFTGAVKLARACAGRVVLLSVPFALGSGLISAALSPTTTAGMRDPFMNLLRLVPTALYGGTLGVLAHLLVIATYVGAAEGRRVTFDQAFTEGLAVWGKGVTTGILQWLMIMLFSLACGLPGLWKATLLAVTSVCVFRLRDAEGTEVSERLIRPRVWESLVVLIAWYVLVAAPGLLTYAVIRGSNGVMPTPVVSVLMAVVGGAWGALTTSLHVALFYGAVRADGQELPGLPWPSKAPLVIPSNAAR
jgi:hypothetical protein